MKLWIPMLVLFLAVTGVTIWDSLHTANVLNNMENKTNEIYRLLTTEELDNLNLSTELEDLNNYWTKKMDILSISISRKDLQPVSDYLQYLCAAIINHNQEDAVTYSRLLSYNVKGLSEATQISHINLL